MHPLSSFPQLLSFGLIAPTLLRVVVSVIGLKTSKARYSKPMSWIAFPSALVSIFILLGFYTQISALAGLLVLAIEYYFESKPLDPNRKALYIIIGIILFTFIFTGPGFLAFDFGL